MRVRQSVSLCVCRSVGVCSACMCLCCAVPCCLFFCAASFFVLCCSLCCCVGLCVCVCACVQVCVFFFVFTLCGSSYCKLQATEPRRSWASSHLRGLPLARDPLRPSSVADLAEPLGPGSIRLANIRHDAERSRKCSSLHGSRGFAHTGSLPFPQALAWLGSSFSVTQARNRQKAWPNADTEACTLQLSISVFGFVMFPH